MNTSMVSRIVRVAAMALMGLVLAGCGSNPSGKYVNYSGSFQVEFNSGKALVTFQGHTVPMKYKAAGNKVVLHGARSSSLVLTRNQDGSLQARYPIGMLREVGARSSVLVAQRYGARDRSADAAAEGLTAMMGGTIILIFLIMLAIYAYFAIAIAVIARKTNHDNRWMAWVPILNVILLLNIAGKPLWWLLLCLVPLVNIVIMVIIWMGVAKARNKPDWWGVFIIVPVLNFILPGVLAFTD